MRQLLLAALISSGCAHAPLGRPRSMTPAPQPPPASAHVERKPGLHSVEEILATSGLAYATLDPGHAWVIGFARDELPPSFVRIIVGPDFTLVMGRLGTVPPGAGSAFYRALARRNFELAQLKLSVDPDDSVFASFEVPNRLVDREELLEDVFTLARLMDDEGALFGPGSGWPVAEPPSPPPGKSPARRRRPSPPPTEASPLILEARR